MKVHRTSSARLSGARHRGRTLHTGNKGTAAAAIRAWGLSALASFLIALFLFSFAGCGDGWDAYEDAYRIQTGGEPGEPWTGPEVVTVVLGAARVDTALEGIETSPFKTSSGLTLAAVRLSDLIDKAGVTSAPEQYRYDFTASDGYNLLIKRGSKDLLPNWEDMHIGYLYLDQEDLRVGWDESEQPWGSAVSAYNVKFMDGGTIELLEP